MDCLACRVRCHSLTDEREMVTMRWGMPPPKLGGAPVTNIRNVSQP